MCAGLTDVTTDWLTNHEHNKHQTWIINTLWILSKMSSKVDLFCTQYLAQRWIQFYFLHFLCQNGKCNKNQTNHQLQVSQTFVHASSCGIKLADKGFSRTSSNCGRSQRSLRPHRQCGCDWGHWSDSEIRCKTRELFLWRWNDDFTCETGYTVAITGARAQSKAKTKSMRLVLISVLTVAVPL